MRKNAEMDDERPRFRDTPLYRRISLVAYASFGVFMLVAVVFGLVQIDRWNATVSQEDCTVNGVSGPEYYSQNQQQWLVHTVGCGDMAITVGNPGYPYSGGQELAAELSIPAAYHLTLHGWGSPKDIVAATPVLASVTTPKTPTP
jgi:hypothetical protein